MNNLTVQQSNKLPTGEAVYKNSLSIDWDLKVAFFVSKQGLYSLNLQSNQCTFLQDLQIEGFVGEDIVCSNFLLEEKLYFLLLQSGKIITFDSCNKELFEYSIDVSSSIDDAKFSHDQELFAIATRDNQMALFNKIMVLQSSYDMNQIEYGTNELVNVNWGSKSTQFHGEGMRDKRSVKEEFFPLNKWDDSKSTLDWRGDDNYFVVNFVCSNGFRMLKLFNRQGILQHTSEYVAGLEKHIAWKPSGSLIASSQMLPNKHLIIFFEKNGLKHGEFDLNSNSNSYIIEKLSWSNDSDILLVCGYETTVVDEDISKSKQTIMLYTQSNYHWFLKQTLSVDLDDFIEDILWDEHQYSLLHFVSSKGYYHAKLFSKTLHTTSDGKVLVVEGNRLHVSDFERTLIPPPMSNYVISFESQIAQLCHSDDLLVVYLNGNQIIVFNIASVTLTECANLNYSVSYNFTNVFSDFVCVYTPIYCKKIDRISEIMLPILLKDGRIFGIIDKKIIGFNYKKSEEICWLRDIKEPISALSILSDKQLSLGSISGQLYCYDIPSNLCEDCDSKMRYDDSVISLLVYTDGSGQSHTIALTARNSLYFDQTLIMSSMVSSLVLYHNKYLLFTTLDNLFYCWPLQNFDTFKLTKTHPPRNLEKGAKIIATSQSQAKVVLQLPRGNLEAFHPRTLLLNQIEQHLDNHDFLKAFEILRKNRINLNYICDYNFSLFTENYELFLEQICLNNVDWVCLFLSELSSENVHSTLNNHAEERVDQKVDTICELLLQRMLQMDRIKLINPILLTYIKREKPQIDKALQVVKDLPSVKLRDGAIKFLLYVVNVNRLFEEALGTYDFDILLMVAAKSNKDPKEYLSMVNGFKAIEDESYRKYKIDMHLQRYQSALLHLSNCVDRYEEALELIEEKRLFKEAIEIYKLNSSPECSIKYSRIWNLYGEYLFKKKYYLEAAIAFNRAANYAQALKMHLMCSNWSLASVCARKLSNTEEHFRKTIHSVSQQLILNNRWLDGAYVLEHYLNDFKEAFLTLVRGHQWDQAIRCFYDHQLEQSLLDDELKRELIAAYESAVQIIQSNLDKVTEYITRLKELKELRSNGRNGPANNKMDDDLDTYSDSSSVFDTASAKSSDTNLSGSSLKTNRTSGRMKNLKRLEQKKYVLKRGSANEDIQLVYAIKELVLASSNILGDCNNLVATLYELFLVQESRALQENVQLLHSQMTNAIDFVWKSEYFERKLAEDDTLQSAPKMADLTKSTIALN